MILKEETTGIAVEETLSEDELVTVKKILWGKPRWPESLYGVPACGFSRKYAFVLDDTRYMMSFDRCGTLCAEDFSPGSSPQYYVDISDTDRQALQEIFERRVPKD